MDGYRIVSALAHGGPFETYEAWSEKRFASCVLKTITPGRAGDPSLRRRLAREGRLLKQFSHPHIVRGYEWASGSAERPYVVMETLGGATLGQALRDLDGPMSATDLALLANQLASALRYVHAHGVLHLDVKPNNIVIDGGRVKLIDFSLAQRPGRVRRGLGTAAYLSPEQARGDRAAGAADVWGLGLTLYEAATGTNPYRAPDPRFDGCATCGGGSGYLQLSAAAPPVAAHRQLPRRLAMMIDAALRPDPDDRPSLSDFGLFAVR